MKKIIYYKEIKRNIDPRITQSASIACLLLIFVFGYFMLGNDTEREGIAYISPLAKVIGKTVAFINSTQNSKGLERIVQRVLEGNEDSYGVAIQNLKTGERYYLNEKKIYETASLYKLWVMATVYQKIESGSLSPTNIVSSDVATLNKRFNISTESAQLTEGNLSWPVQNALEKMITISDNYAAYLLTSKVSLKSVSDLLENYNLSESKIGTISSNPLTSAIDIANFYKKLYDGDLANTEDTNNMITLLKGQKINTKLSKELPEKAIIAHKTGELGTFSHDAGIVYTQKGDYIIVILSNTPTPLSANNNIAEISKEVYSYFNTK